MKNQTKNIYFPLFYKYESHFSLLSKEEVGELVHAILVSEGRFPPAEPMESKLEVIYKLIISDADLLFRKNSSRSTCRVEPKGVEKPQKMRHGDFDYDEAFERALARSYSNKEV